MPEKRLHPMVKKSIGPSDERYHWYNLGTTGGATCEICGTDYPENEDVRIDSILGRQVVIECCGGLIDSLYGEFGPRFAVQYLEDFAEDPTKPQFGFLRRVLSSVLQAAGNRTELVAREIAENQKSLERITKATE